MKERPCYAYADRAADTVMGATYRLEQIPVGKVLLTSGLIEACDPFVSLGDAGYYSAPKGEFTVFATVARTTDNKEPDPRVAYLSVVFSDDPAVRYEDAAPLNVDQDKAADEEWVFGVGVDAGIVAFVDRIAAESMKKHIEENDIDFVDTLTDHHQPDSWFSLLENPDHYAHSVANIPLPFVTGGENVVMSFSGWGDGFYPVLAGFSADGDLVSYHIDLHMVDTPAA
ncbi:MAG: DUF4241 domain-containing protein [Corynebacterium sp.]|uniref:DUF4241 domain-containing protein n=1 Tax=Corynebacterium sp. TaxID=1720 RepID=UPI0026DC807F|nr:DUF4241 domain-containing protein [Corynebacterium sp.]MDO5098365.1 DUF4241 domain-containing protein [Corynebacterium sp.]